MGHVKACGSNMFGVRSCSIRRLHARGYLALDDDQIRNDIYDRMQLRICGEAGICEQ